MTRDFGKFSGTVGLLLPLALGIPSRAAAQRGAGPGGGRGTPAPVVHPPPASMRPVPDGFTIAVAGDMLDPARPVSQHPLMAPIVKIIRGADAAFANLEGFTFDMSMVAYIIAADTSDAVAMVHSEQASYIGRKYSLFLYGTDVNTTAQESTSPVVTLRRRYDTWK